MIDVTISIVNWNTGDLLLQCLKSIEQTRGDLRLQVIVVDNNSNDDSFEKAKFQFGWAEFIKNFDNRGFSVANNQALALAEGEFFLLLNPDTVLHPKALEQMVNFLRSHSDVGAVGPKLVYGDGSLQRNYSSRHVSPRSILSNYLGWKILGEDPLSDIVPEQPVLVTSLMGACLLLRRSAIEQIGPMDEKFFLVYEEADWCYRLVKAGWTIWYLPEAVVTHFCSQSSKQIWGKGLIETNQSLKYYIKKHYGTLIVNVLSIILISLYCWWLLKTLVKEVLVGANDELKNRRIRFKYLLIGLLMGKHKESRS